MRGSARYECSYLPIAIPCLRVARGRDHRILPVEWRVENFQTVPGNPDLVIGPKLGRDYVTTQRIDEDGDGISDVSISGPRYELRFIHARSGATLWLQTFPVDGTLGDVDLRVLARRFADSIGGAGIVTARVGTRLVSAEHRYSTRISMERRARVHGQDAFLATIDVADVDQAQVWSSSRYQRLRIALIRPPFPFAGDRLIARVPLVMLVALLCDPDYFDEHLPDFDRFLGQIVFTATGTRMRRGLELLDVLPPAPEFESATPPASEPPPTQPQPATPSPEPTSASSPSPAP